MRLKSAGVHTTNIDGQTVVLDTDGARYLTTNTTGTLLIEALREGASMSELAALLVARHDLDLDVAQRDCERFVASLREFDLLEG